MVLTNTGDPWKKCDDLDYISHEYIDSGLVLKVRHKTYEREIFTPHSRVYSFEVRDIK